MGLNFLALLIGSALSGVTYTSLFGVFRLAGHPEFIWYTLATHLILGIGFILVFIKVVGEFKEREE